ncbi:hypothetical protein CABS01_10332 [Colletotrichum abscissum]|uniref:Ankyrin repeat protein n=1 Tax=Colletotrichum abscissum TaxID=1671311 RepID=A0A9P9XND6_9PEZI|nr:uncharacterized protein CABS01_10332 [Colletotrichum abscissum]KAI3557093.1 hypothetical protein CABS02_02644 [Colletotrichum abscissum]KAK1499934.1 hypothetical protein CABS01_10332 [Colletotrichum abscissum]
MAPLSDDEVLESTVHNASFNATLDATNASDSSTTEAMASHFSPTPPSSPEILRARIRNPATSDSTESKAPQGLLSPPKDSSNLRSERNSKESLPIVFPVTLATLPEKIVLHIVDSVFERYDTDLRAGYNEDEVVYEPHFEVTEVKFHRFDVWRDIAHLASTCKRLNEIITPILYTEDIEQNDSSCLLLSAKRRNLPGIQQSLLYGADVNTEDCTEFQLEDGDYHCVTRVPVLVGLTSLHWSAYCRHSAALQLLLDHGADVNLETSIATSWGDRRFVTRPLANFFWKFDEESFDIPLGARYLLRNEVEAGANALYFALMEVKDSPCSDNRHEARVAATKLLIEAGASLITHRGTDLHALHQACSNWDLETARILLESKLVKHDVRDALGNTPLHYLVMENPSSVGHTDPVPLIQLLEKHGADANARNAAGCSPLQCITDKSTLCYANIAIALLDMGAHVSPDTVSSLQRIGVAVGGEAKLKLEAAVAAANRKACGIDEPSDILLPEERRENERLAVHAWMYKRWVLRRDGGNDIEEMFVGEGTKNRTLNEWNAFWRSTVA